MKPCRDASTPAALPRERALRGYLNLVAGLPRMSEAAQARLAGDAACGDERALRALVESFLPLVLVEAAARRGMGPRFETLLAAGNQGLLRCLRRAPSDLDQVPAAVSNSLDKVVALQRARRAGL
jgi:DNA-directed RNA polymerase sigma subunit (sigma70/sigma32)